MKIKAYAFEEKGGKAKPIFYTRSIGKNDVFVWITHCGIARGDIQIIDNDWGDTKFPVVPGHEIIGIVEDGGHEVTGLNIGDRVGIGYQQEACFECEYCREGNEQFCPNQKVIAVDTYGGLAEHIMTDSRFVFRIPSKLNSANSVPLLSSGLAVYTGIIAGKLPSKSTVAVLGVGGLGQLAIQFLKKMGHRVSAFSHSSQKRALVSRLEAEYIDASDQEHLRALNTQFDFIISTLNVQFDIDTYLRKLRPQGKFCLVAQPPGKLPVSMGLLYEHARRTIYGNYTGSRSDMISMIDFATKHHIEGFVDVVPFSKMNDAFDMVRRGNGSTRVVLENRVWRTNNPANHRTEFFGLECDVNTTIDAINQLYTINRKF